MVRLFLRSLAISRKVKHSVTMYLSNFTPSFKFHRIENICLHKNLYMMFIAALSIIAQKWKQSKWPSADELIDIMWYIPAMEYYLTINKAWSANACYNTDESWIQHANFKKSTCSRIYMWIYSYKRPHIVGSMCMKCPE